MNARSRRSRFLRPLVIVLVLLVTGAWVSARIAASKPTSAASSAPAPAALEFTAADVIKVQERALTRTLPLTGTLSPHTETVVKARAAGELQSLTVREGETVARAQIIGHIDPTDARARLAQQQAELEAARAQLQMSQKNWQLQQQLLKREFISRNAFDNTESSHEVATARVRAAEAAVAVAAKALRDTELLAPIDGIVAQRFAKPGERVAVDARVLSIVNLTRLEMAAPVPATDIAQLRVGQAVSFRVEGYADTEFTGKLERINPAALSGSRSIDVYVVVDNPHGKLRGGLFATGRITLEALGASLVVPRSAVHAEGERQFVYVIEAGRIARREVRLGVEIAEEAVVQVLAGIAEHDVIIRHNLGQFADGAPARIAPAQAG